MREADLLNTNMYNTAIILCRIHILEKRLKRHEEQALHKYYELDHKLRADPRLAQLTKPL